MNDPYNLQRFIDAQDGVFSAALAELAAGRKQSHWMWFIFPQLSGLGRSPTAKFFGIASSKEALAYLVHPLLGARLREAVEVVLPWSRRRTAEQIFGSIDSLKLRSSLTLFDTVEPRGLFEQGLVAFYDSAPDEQTLALLNGQQ